MNETKDKEIGTFPLILGGMSFIPLIGVLFAFIVIIIALIGMLTGRRKSGFLMLLGLLGICFTVLIYGSLIFMANQKDGVFAKMTNDLDQVLMGQAVADIELYKVQNGKYPEKLQDIPQLFGKPAQPQNYSTAGYYYELTADKQHYYLLFTGPDKKPFTADDIVPVVDNSKGKLGLLIKK